MYGKTKVIILIFVFCLINYFLYETHLYTYMVKLINNKSLLFFLLFNFVSILFFIFYLLIKQRKIVKLLFKKVKEKTKRLKS